MDANLLFQETQTFPRVLKRLLFSLVVLPIGIAGAGVYTQEFLHQPFGNHPTTTGHLLFLLMVPTLVCLATALIIAIARLTTEVDQSGVRLIFRPFSTRFIPFAEIASLKTVEYRPIRDAGGWGIHFYRMKGWAYNVSGNSGVEITLKNGKLVLIGSQRSEELETAIRRILPAV
jgi:hypothetical protein